MSIYIKGYGVTLIILLLKFGIILYGFILFVKLANRGIKLMDIIIEKKNK